MYKYKDFCLTVLQNRNTIRSELHMQAIARMFSSGLGEDQVTVYICFQLHNTHTEVHKFGKASQKHFCGKHVMVEWLALLLYIWEVMAQRELS
jgi:hypothetical protein